MAVQGMFRSPMTITRFHDLNVETLNGHSYSLDRYRGKVVVIINIASFGQDAAKIYNQMNDLQSKYSNQLAVLGFPCNQFKHMEPSNGTEILETMKYLRPGNDFHPVFEVLNKVEVNGSNTHPVFKLLKEVLPIPADDLHTFVESPGDITWAPVCRNDITDNFEKFIVAPNGKPFRRYSAKVQPVNLQNDIQLLLEKFANYREQ